MKSTVLTKLTILGCGTSTGVPIISCKCPVCRSRNPKNKRLRAAAWFQTRGKSILIDTPPDLRTQALAQKLNWIDAVLFTHPHADHVHGIDELRSYNFIQKQTIPLYGNAWTCDELKTRFPYIFKADLYPSEGGGIPHLTLNQINSTVESMEISGVPVTPISLQHGSKETLGYRIDSVAYVVDCSYISPSSLDRMKGLSALVLDCVRLRPHGTHFHLDRALETISLVQPKSAYLTHLGHDFDFVKWRKKLPKGVFLAYDGLTIQTKSEVVP